MAVRETGPTDDEFSKLMDERAPNRLKEADPLPEYAPSSTLLGSAEVPAPSAAEPVVEAPPVAVADPVAPVVPAVDPKYAGKTTDELIEMHRNAEQLVGRQGQQLGDYARLQSEVDQLKGALAARESEPNHAPLTQETVDWVEESVLGNGRGTMEWVEKNQPALIERTLQTWAAVDPYAAASYNTEKLLAEQRKYLEDKFATVEAPFRAQMTDTQLQTAYYTVSNSLPGFTEVAEDLPALLEANPEFRVALVNGDLAQKQRILENLGKMAFANRALAQPVNVAPAVPQPPVEQPRDPRLVAAVASGSSAGEHGGEAATPTDKLKASMLASEPTSLHEELARNRASAR